MSIFGLTQVSTKKAIFGFCCGIAVAAVVGDGRAAGRETDDGSCQPLNRVVDQMAAELYGELERELPLTVALKPFHPAESAITETTARRINDGVTRALRRASDGRVVPISRRNLQAAWSEVDEFRGSKMDALVNAAAADVLIIGIATPAKGGLLLGYKAIDLRKGREGRNIANAGERCVRKQDTTLTDSVDYTFAVKQAAASIVRRLGRHGTIRPESAVFQQTGERSEFGEFLVDLLIEELQERIEATAGRNQGPVAVGGKNKDSGNNATSFFLQTVIRDHGEEAFVTFVLESAKGRPVLRESARINKSSIPKHYLPLSKQQVARRDGFYRAVGEARAGARFNLHAATRIARSLARARLVTTALRLEAPQVERGREVADATALLTVLSRGIPFDESWRHEDRPGRLVITNLRAKVKALDAAAAPKIEAALSTKIVGAEEPFSLKVKLDREGYLAVFVWQADDTVLRLYPRPDARPVVIVPGQDLSLPRQGESPFMSVPMPESDSDHEAMVLVASTSKLAFDKFAPAVGGNVMAGVKAGTFLARLAKHQGSPLALKILPYQVNK